MTYAMHDKNESLQYEFPPQMFHLRAGWNPVPYFGRIHI